MIPSFNFGLFKGEVHFKSRPWKGLFVQTYNVKNLDQFYYLGKGQMTL